MQPRLIVDDVGIGTMPHTEESVLHQLTQGGFVQFHPALAEKLGFKSALFLGHALYWSRHLAKTQPRRQGWFYMTAQQWENATGLTAREQASIRQQLVESGLLVEQIGGKPARLHYRVDLSVLAQWAGLSSDVEGQPSVTWAMFSPWLKGSVAFYRPLVDLAGSVAAGLYLSYLLRAQHDAARAQRTTDGYFRLSHEDVRIALCLGTKTQRNAREKLKANGLLHERSGGACRVDLEALLRAMGVPAMPVAPRAASAGLVLLSPSRAEPSDTPSIVRWDDPVGQRGSHSKVPATGQRNLLSRWVGNSHEGRQLTRNVAQAFAVSANRSRAVQPWPADASTGAAAACQPFALLSKLEPAVLSKLAESAKLDGPFVEPDLPFCRTPISIQINKETTTNAGAREARTPIDKTAGRRRRISSTSLASKPDDLADLPMPRGLSKDWHASVQRTLRSAPAEVRQTLLDELEGQLGAHGKTIHNPPGYLHSLIRRNAAGNLTLAFADKVAADRRERERVAATVQASVSSTSVRAKGPTEGAGKPASSGPSAEIRQRMAALSKAMGGKGGRS